MGKKANNTTSGGEVQVFELTMDNPEDQDELNRQMRKPEEPDRGASAQIRGAAQGESTTKPPTNCP